MEEIVKICMGKIGMGGKKAKARQTETLEMICGGDDVFCLLPTGYGKSAIYALLPYVVDEVGHLIIVDCKWKIQLFIQKETFKEFILFLGIYVGKVYELINLQGCIITPISRMS